MNILIYCVVLGGSGDIMFAKHLGKYVTKWCSEDEIDVKLSYAFNTLFDPDPNSLPKRLNNSGIKKDQIVKLKSLHKSVNMHAITPYGTTKSKHGFDLFLLAPATTAFYRLPEYAYYGLERVTDRVPGPADKRDSRPWHYYSDEMYVSKKGLIVDDLSRSFSGASSSNTLLFSVYNPEDDSDENNDFDFPMGVGEGKFGIFIPRAPQVTELPRELQGKRFALIYVSKNAPEACVNEFVNSVRETYKHMLPVSIVLPNHVYNKLTNKSIDGIEFLPNILPLKPDKFAAVVKCSLPHIMTTGNQSVGEIIACCTDKIMWYQGETWTAAFGDALKKYGGVYTCTNEDGKNPTGNLLEIKTHYDFEHRAKPKFMAILKTTREALYVAKDREQIEEMQNISDYDRQNWLEKLGNKEGELHRIMKNVFHQPPNTERLRRRASFSTAGSNRPDERLRRRASYSLG